LSGRRVNGVMNSTACQSGRFCFIALVWYPCGWHYAGGAFAMLVLIIEEYVRRERLQNLMLGNTTEEKGFVDTNIPGA